MAQILSPDMPHRLACSVNVSIPHQTRTAVTHSSHPGRPGHHLAAAQGLRSSPPLHTPLLPPEGTPFSWPANDFFVKSHWGLREGGRTGGRARPEPRTCFKLQDLGDGPGQCPTVTPGLAWPQPADVSCNGKLLARALSGGRGGEAHRASELWGHLKFETE